MVTSEDVKKWEETHGKATSGGYDIIDESGNAIGSAEYNKENEEAFRAGGTFYEQPGGGFSPVAKGSVDFNTETGKITINIPKTYQDDKTLKSLLDNSALNNLSANYKANKDVQYQDPYDETKKISTEKYIEYLNSAVSDRVSALNAVPQLQAWLIQKYGGTDEKNAAIMKLDADHVLIAATNGVGENANEDSLVSLPQYIQDAFPKLKELSKDSNGFVKAGQFMNEFYKVGSGELSDAQAEAIERSTENALKDIENLSPEEIARTVAFSQFLAEKEPTRNGWDSFWKDVSSFTMGMGHNIYEGVFTTLDTLANIATTVSRSAIGMITTGTVPKIQLKQYFESAPTTQLYDKWQEQNQLIDSGAFVAGTAGQATGTMLENLAEIALTQVAFDALAADVASKITTAGTEKLAIKIAEETDVAAAMAEGGAMAQLGAKAGKGAKTVSVAARDYEAFTAITKNASQIANKVLGVTEVAMRTMSTQQLARITEAAFKVLRNAKLANTALGVTSTFTISALVFNKDLTNKVIRSEATPAEVKTWIGQVTFDAATAELISAAARPAIDVTKGAIKGTKAGKAISKVNETISRGLFKTTDMATAPYQKFRQWANQRKAEAQAMSKAGIKNTTLANEQAIVEAQLSREYRNWMTSQSVSTEYQDALNRAAGTSGASIVKEITSGVYDPVSEITEDISPFMAARAGLARLDNILTDIGDIQTLEAQFISNISDPDVEPVMSQQVTEHAKSVTTLLNLESDAGLLPSATIKANKPLTSAKKLKTSPYEAFYAGHSKEAVIYANRSQDLTEIIDKSKANNIPLNEDNKDYVAALNARNAAAENLPAEIVTYIDESYLPSLRALEHSIQNYRMDPINGLISEEWVNGMRASGEFGKDGGDWIRRVAAKDVPEGVYTPLDRLSGTDPTIDMHRSKVLEDEDLTWPDTGLHVLIRETAEAEAYKRLVGAARQADGLIIRTVKTGTETSAARKAKEYEKDFKAAVKDGLSSIAEDMKLSKQTIARKKDLANKAAQESKAVAGAMSANADELRVILKDAKAPTTDDITSQETLDSFYEKSTKAGRDILEKSFPEGQNGLNRRVSYQKISELGQKNPAKLQQILDSVDAANAIEFAGKSKELNAIGEETQKLIEQQLAKGQIYDTDISVEVKPSGKNKTADNLKYDLDTDKLISDVDDAIDGAIELVAKDNKAQLYIAGANTLGGYEASSVRTEFYVLSEILSNSSKDIYKKTVSDIAKQLVDSSIPKNKAVIKGNLDSVYSKVEKLVKDRFDTRLANAKNTLEDMGEVAESDTVAEKLRQYDKEITGLESETTYIRTTNSKGETEYLEVTPALGRVYNKRPIYKPMGSVQSTLANFALIKRISTTNINPRAFSKQAVSDPAMAWVTTGAIALPGMYTQTVKAISAQFGDEIAAQIEHYDPRRFANIQMIAEREGVSLGEAAVKNIEALANNRLPFTTMSEEALRQANVNKYGIKGRPNRKTLNESINSSLRKVSEKLGTPNDRREIWTRKVAGVKEEYDMLSMGYNYAQAEEYKQFAINNATTNFRQKHAVFNALRSTVPYLTAGVSGAKSFWKMFEMDPIGVTARILTGFVMPIMYFMGEIMEDDKLKEQYNNLAEYEKEDHIIIAVGGQLVRIPVGEELGTVVNPIMHIVENTHNANQYSFWLLMLNDMVGFYPVDLTGFTDPDMWENITGQTPSFMDVMGNGVSTVLSSTMPPVLQSAYMVSTGRDLYTGKQVNTSYITIDNDGNAVVESYSQSEFAKGLASLVGGDARVIEKVTSGIFGTTALHALDTITSAVQYIGSQGQAGSLTTAIDKAVQDIAAPYTVSGYNSLDRRLGAAINNLYDEKKKIENSEEYQKYNTEISKATDAKTRQNLIAKRNGLFTEFQNRIASLVANYRDNGGSLNSYRFSQFASLLTFEDAVRADRSFMHLNTEYYDARVQALRTLYDMGITNPEGPSMLGYVYLDDSGHEQVKVWTPAQIQIIQNTYYQQGDIYQAQIKAIIESDEDGSIKKLKKTEEAAEQPYWDKYNSTGKLSNSEWNAIDNLRKAYDAQVVIALRDYVDTYGAANVINNETVMDYLENIIKVPSSYEKINGRNVSSGGGKLNKTQGFVRSYMKQLFGVK